MFLPEEKLSVEIAQIDRIEVNDVDLAEAGEDKVLQQFTANASSTNHQDSGLLNTSVRHGGGRLTRGLLGETLHVILR